MYFAATIAIHHSTVRVVALSMGGVAISMVGWHILWGVAHFMGGGFNFGPYLLG